VSTEAAPERSTAPAPAPAPAPVPTTDAVTEPVDLAEPLDATEPADAAPDQAGAAGAARWYPQRALLVYAAIRVATVAVVAVSTLFSHRSMLHDLEVWDGKWFLRAVEHGYPAHLPMVDGHVAANPIAFFPLFPLLVRALDLTGLPAGWSALLLSALTGATAVLAVGLLARRLAGDRAGQRAALLFTVFPGSFVFSLPYSEGLVITAVAFGLLALLDRRWLLAGLLGAVATAGSPVALAFVVSCVWCAGRAVLRDRQYRALVAPLLAPLGFVAFMAYLARHTGTLNAWRLTERGGWKSYPSLKYPFEILWAFLHNPISPTQTGQVLFFGTVAAVIGIVLMIREHQPAALLLYGICAVGSAAISQPVGLRPRFLLLAFPMIIALGTRYQGRAHRWLVAVSAVLLLGFSLMEIAQTRVFP
jgi:hypothetical protein